MDLVLYVMCSVCATLWLCCVGEFLMEEVDRMTRKRLIEHITVSVEALNQVSDYAKATIKSNRGAFSESNDHIQATIDDRR